MDRRADLLVGLVVLAVGIAILVAALTAPPPRTIFDVLGPYGFAMFVGSALTVGALALVVRDIVGLSRKQRRIDDDVAEDEPGQPASARRAAAIVGLTFGYTVLIPIAGYIIASLAYVATAMLALSERGKALVVGAAFAYTAVTFVLFGVVL